MEDKGKLIKIYRYCCDICDVLQNSTLEDFIRNKHLMASCAFYLLQIGGLANTLENDAVKKSLEDTGFSLKEFHNMRDRIMNHYDIIGGQYLYKVAKFKIPNYKKNLLLIAMYTKGETVELWD